MRNIILSVALLLSAARASAVQSGNYNVNVGVGAFGSRGLVGVSLEKFVTGNHAVSGALGLDYIGAVSAIGYKYFSDKKPVTDSAWDKCFFFIDCDTYFYAGPSLQYANGVKTTFTEGTAVREYQTEYKLLGVVSAGVRNQFKNNVTLDAEITYRTLLAGGKSTQTSGVIVDEQKSLEMGYRTLGIGFAVGYVF